MDNNTIDVRVLLVASKPFRKVATGAELVLVMALNDYAKKILGKRVDCTNCRVNKELRGQELFYYACDPVMQPEGVIFHPEDVPTIQLARYGRPYLPYISNVIDELVMEKNDTEWRFRYSYDVVKNSEIRKGITKHNYIYIVAKWIVECYAAGKFPRPPLVIDRDGYTLKKEEYSYLIMLKKYGNQCFNDSEIVIPDMTLDDDGDAEWVAFCEEKRARGLMQSVANRYSPKDKKQYLLKNLKLTKGDLVILFRRKAGKNSGDVTQNLAAAYPAVITDISDSNLTLTYYASTELKLTRKYHIDRLRRNGGEAYYSSVDYSKFDPLGRVFDWHEIGIEGYASTETFLIIPPVRDDSTIQYINDGEKDVEVQLDTIETMYALFEDRKLPYDKERFLNKYFKESVPIYDQYKEKREAYLAEHAQA